MKAIKIALVLILALNIIYSVVNWLSPGDSQQTDTAMLTANEEILASADEGLDLKALTGLVKEVRSGQELERRLNEENSINNLDLNADSQVDYLNVSEFGNAENKIGYSVTTEPVKNEVQEIAEITVEKNGQTAEIQVIGNEQIYGQNAIFNDSTPIERDQSAEKVTGANGVPRYSSYFYPHPLWISPWFFGFYPPFFSPFPVVSRSVYYNRSSRYNQSSTRSGRSPYQSKSTNKISNPNKGKIANKGISRSLRRPTASQKSFQTAQRKSVGSGGFGKTSRSTTTTGKRSSGSSFGTSSKSTTSGFGARKSIFGSSSGSSSFRSKSVGSRSFSFGK